MRARTLLPLPEEFTSAPTADDLERWRAADHAARPGRLTTLRSRAAEERLDALLDPGTFTEFGLLADHMEPSLAHKGSFAADGCVTGVGQVDGRRIAVCAYDFTVQAGSMGRVNEFKVTRMRELALQSASSGVGNTERGYIQT